MESESYFFKLKSHPEKMLVDHLRNAGLISRQIVTSNLLNMEMGGLLRDVAYLMGATHDMGKATRFFQEYIREEDEVKRRSLKARENTHHGLLSALFTFAVVKNYLEQSKNGGGLADYLPLFSFLAVKRHHGNLLNAMNEISIPDPEKEVLEEQLAALDRVEVEEIFKALLSDEDQDVKINIKIDGNSIIDYVSNGAILEIKGKVRRQLRDLQSKGDIFPYFLVQFLYSALLEADKMDAAGLPSHLERIDTAADLVDGYRESRGFSSSIEGINALRNQIYEDSTETIGNWDLDDRIISMNVPTGTGKTLTSLSVALKLRARLNRERCFKPRIIYALPFLSIIDQNFEVFEDVLIQDGDWKDSRLLLKHHHLADASYSIENDEFEADKSLLMIEGWNAEVIVTTFWQLFHTLFSNRNRQLRKFNKLANSIIILDEVQAVPHHYWLLIHDALKMLCERFNSYVILVTATQPLIFDEAEGEIKEIVGQKEAYFQGLDRIELTPRIDDVLSLEEFKDLLGKEFLNNSEKDFLIVLNTINSANQIYDFVEGLDLENTACYYLSTNIIPKERLKRIKEIKNDRWIEKSKGEMGDAGSGRNKAGKEAEAYPESGRRGNRKIVVSTQLIEAGVDIDADVIWRDFAPLDSINQVCGRCNRNSSRADKGTVSIFRLKDDKKEFHKYIYDSFLIERTLQILKPIRGAIKESEFLDLNKKYFKAVKMGMSEEESKANLQCLSLLAFGDLSQRFKLIEEDAYKVDIFVEVDEDAAEVWRLYMEIKSLKDPLSRRNEFLKIKRALSEHVISVSRKYAACVVERDQEMGYISMDELPYYYNLKTGFMTKKAGEGSMIF